MSIEKSVIKHALFPTGIEIKSSKLQFLQNSIEFHARPSGDETGDRNVAENAGLLPRLVRVQRNHESRILKYLAK